MIILPEGYDDISITLCEEDSSIESTSIKVDDEESLISASSPRGSPTAEDSRSNFDFYSSPSTKQVVSFGETEEEEEEEEEEDSIVTFNEKRKMEERRIGETMLYREMEMAWRNQMKDPNLCGLDKDSSSESSIESSYYDSDDIMSTCSYKSI